MVKMFPSGGGSFIKILLLIALVALFVQLRVENAPSEASHSEMVLQAEQGSSDMSLRNVDYPETFISKVEVDLTTPSRSILLHWSGNLAEEQEKGPFRSSPGRGRPGIDCNNTVESNRGGSNCTPKGTHLVEGFGDSMASASSYKYVTWIHSSREIGIHSYPVVADYPDSSGCIRVDEHTAQLIHNNAIVGVTEVVVDGTWMRPPTGG